jgi:hypothetical protein
MAHKSGTGYKSGKGGHKKATKRSPKRGKK